MPEIAAVQKSFEPAAFLWRTASEVASQLPLWMDGPFSALDPEVIAATVDRWWRGTQKIMKHLKPGPPTEVAERIKAQARRLLAPRTLSLPAADQHTDAPRRRVAPRERARGLCAPGRAQAVPPSGRR